MNRFIAVIAIVVTPFLFVNSAWAQAVSVITLTNGPPNLPAALIQAGMPSGSLVSDVYADNAANTSFAGTFNQPTGANASSFSISTVTNCGSAENITCGKLVTKGVLAAGTYNITLTTSQGGSQNVTINAANGTRIACGNDATIQSAINAAGPNTTFLLAGTPSSPCTYNIGTAIVPQSGNQMIGAGIGVTILDAGGGTPTPNGGCNSGFTCSYQNPGVLWANVTFQNLQTNLSNPYGCNFPAINQNDCTATDFMVQLGDNSTVQNSLLQNAAFGAVAIENTGFNFINNTIKHMGGYGLTGSPDNLSSSHVAHNIIGNDISDVNFNPINVCDGAGNKFLANNYTMNVKYNYMHNIKAPAFWEDSYSGQTMIFTGNTFVNDGAGNGAPGAIMFENDAAANGDVGFNVFIDNGNSIDSPTGNDPVCGGEGHAAEAIVITSSSGITVHDNNISSRMGPPTPYGQWAGGSVIVGQEGSGTVTTCCDTIETNSITFFTAAPGSGSPQGGFGMLIGSAVGNINLSNMSASGNAYHYVYSGAVAGDPHFSWSGTGSGDWGGTLRSLGQFQSAYGQESGATLDFADKSANGCLHTACAVNPVGPGGVQQGLTATLAMQNITLSNNTFAPNVANGTVGTVSITMSDGSAFSGTLSITGTNSGGFHLSGNTLEEKASGGTPAGNYNDFNIVATQSNASNSPQQISPTLSGVAEAPFGGTVRSITNRIQAEDFDLGGYGVAYHATDACGISFDTAYGSDRLNVYATADLDGESNLKVGCNQAGDWHNYTITVPNNGFYTLSIRVANITAGSTYHVTIDGVSAVQGIAVPNTGGYDAFATVTSVPFALTAGQHVMQIVLDTGSAGGFGGDFNWIQGTLVTSGIGTTKNIDITVTH